MPRNFTRADRKPDHYITSNLQKILHMGMSRSHITFRDMAEEINKEYLLQLFCVTCVSAAFWGRFIYVTRRRIEVQKALSWRYTGEIWNYITEEIRKKSHFGFVFQENSGREIMKSSFLKIECFQSTQPVHSSSSCLKSIVKKFRFRDGCVWTVVLTVEIKLRFQFSPV